MIFRHSFIGLMTAASISAALALVPGDLERLAMLERDGRHEDALTELQRQSEAGRLAGPAQLRLYSLKVRFGDLVGAQAVLEDYARARPRDVQAQIGLLRFYQSTQQEAPYVETLKSVVEWSRNRELQTELIGHYRLKGDFREEEDLLERLARANRANTPELERLGLLAAARGDLQRAVRALRRVDARLEPQQQAPRFSLFQALIDLKQHEEAYDRASTWLRLWQERDVAIELMEKMAQAGRADLAVALGNRFGGAGSEVTLVTAELLSEQGRYEEARARLAEYQSAGLPEGKDAAERLVAVALEAGDPLLALRAARHIGLRKLGGETVVDLIEGLQDAAEGESARPVALTLLRGLAGELEDRVQNTAPIGEEARDSPALTADTRLFAARLALADERRDLAQRFLTGIDPDRLEPETLAEWTELQLASGLRATEFPNLGRRWGRSQGTATARRPPRTEPQSQDALAKGQMPATSEPERRTGDRATSTAETTTKARRAKRKVRYIERLREARRQAALRRAAQSGEAAPPGKALPSAPPTGLGTIVPGGG